MAYSWAASSDPAEYVSAAASCVDCGVASPSAPRTWAARRATAARTPSLPEAFSWSAAIVLPVAGVDGPDRHLVAVAPLVDRARRHDVDPLADRHELGQRLVEAGRAGRELGARPCAPSCGCRN